MDRELCSCSEESTRALANIRNSPKLAGEFFVSSSLVSPRSVFETARNLKDEFSRYRLLKDFLEGNWSRSLAWTH